MARGVPLSSSSFGGGLNTSGSPLELEKNQSPDLLNIRVTMRGAARKRQGMLDMSNGTNFESQPRKIAVYQVGATTKVVALGAKLQSLEPANAPGAAFTPTTVAPWTWAWAIGKQVSSQGPLFLMSDTDKLYFDGTAFGSWTAATGAIPTGAVMCPHQNRLFVGNVTSTQDATTAVVFSEIGDYRTWPVDNVVKFDPFQGDRITALASSGSYLMVFKRDGIWRVFDSDTGANQKITSQAGTVFRDSVVATDNGVFFLDPDRGVMITDGSSVKPVSDDILPELRGLPLDPVGAASVSAAFWEGSYFLSVPDGTGMPQWLLEYDVVTQAWTKHDCAAYDLQVTSFGQSSDAQLVRDALVGAVPAKVLNRLGVSLSPSTFRLMHLLRAKTSADRVVGEDPKPIAFRWRSPPSLLAGDGHMSKRLQQLRVDAVGPGAVSQLRDFAVSPESVGPLGAGADASEPGTWGGGRPGNWGGERSGYVWGGGGTGVVQSRFFTLGVASVVQFQVSGLSSSEFELHSYAWFVGPRGRKD